MKYFPLLKDKYCTLGSSTSEGLTDGELRRLLQNHRSLSQERFPVAVEEYLQLFGKKTGNFGDGGFGEFDTFSAFKLEMIYQSVDLNLSLPARKDFVFYNNRNKIFSYFELNNFKDDPFVSLFSIENGKSEIINNYCKFSSFIIQHEK